MPRRWNRFRPMTEYGHLIGTSRDIILDGAIRNRVYGQDLRGYPVEVNQYLIGLFEGREHLTRADLMEAADVLRVPREWSVEFATDYVGNRVGWGLHLGILVEGHSPDGEHVWTMPDREMRYALFGSRAVQIRGLEPLAQAAMDRRVRAQVKLNATLNRKAAEAAAPEIVRILADIAKADPDAVIPDFWSHYVPADIRERWPRIAEASGLLADLHHGWSRFWIKRWMGQLKDARKEALGRAAVLERAAQAVLDAEDAAAFASLEDL